MINPLVHSTAPEDFHHHSHRLIDWKSSLGGLLVTFMAYLLLTALGAGIGGMTASHLINHDESGNGFGTATGLWLGLTAVASLFLGSYFAVRVSRYQTTRAGAANGFLIASMFFILLIWGAGHSVSILGGEMGRMGGTIYSDGTVVPGQTVVTAQDANAVADAGWSLFATFVVGLIGAALGGRTAAHANVQRPIHRAVGVSGGSSGNTNTGMGFNPNSPAANVKGSAAPYVLGWFMGVPASVLFLIFVLRGC